MPDNRVKIIIEGDSASAVNATKKLEQETGSAVSKMGKAWETLKIKSGSEVAEARAEIVAAYKQIKGSGTATPDDITRAHRAMHKEIEDLERTQLTRTKGIITTLKENWLALTAAVAGVMIALNKAWNLAELAAKFKQSRAAFHSMVQSMGLDAEMEFGKIKKASAGLIDTKSLTESANKAISLGIPVEKLGDLMSIARAKARDMGITTNQAFNDIATGIGRGSPLILDNLGLVLKLGEANDKMARTLGKTVEQLTAKEQKMAILNATIDAGKEALDRYDLSQITVYENMQRLRATVADVQLMIGTVLVRAFSLLSGTMHFAIGVMYAIEEGLSKIVRLGAYASDTLGLTTNAVDRLTKHIEQSGKSREENIRRFEDDIKAVFTSSEDLAVAMRRSDDEINNVALAAKAAADEYTKLKSGLEKEIALVGLEGFERKLKEIELAMPELEKAIGKKQAKVIFELSLELINKEDIQIQLDEIMQSYMSAEEKIIAEAKEAAQQQADARQWLTDRIFDLTLSEFDYQRMTLLKEYEERAKVLGWSTELYETFKDDLKRIDNEELEHRKITLRQIQDAEIAHQLAIIDLKEKSFEISKGEANKERLALYEKELASLKQQYDETLGVADKDLERLEILREIDEVNSQIVDSLRLQKELSGTLTEGMKDGWRDFIDSLKTDWQDGYELVQTGLGSIQDTLSDITSDAMKGELKSGYDYWLQLLDSIQKKLADILVQWALFGEGGPGAKDVGGLFGMLGLDKLFEQSIEKPKMPGAGSEEIQKEAVAQADLNVQLGAQIAIVVSLTAAYTALAAAKTAAGMAGGLSAAGAGSAGAGLNLGDFASKIVSAYHEGGPVSSSPLFRIITPPSPSYLKRGSEIPAFHLGGIIPPLSVRGGEGALQEYSIPSFHDGGSVGPVVRFDTGGSAGPFGTQEYDPGWYYDPINKAIKEMLEEDARKQQESMKRKFGLGDIFSLLMLLLPLGIESFGKLFPIVKPSTYPLQAGFGQGQFNFGNLASGLHHGGGYAKFHQGALAADEIRAILQKDEFVVSRKGVQGLRSKNMAWLLDAINEDRFDADKLMSMLFRRRKHEGGYAEDDSRYDLYPTLAKSVRLATEGGKGGFENTSQPQTIVHKHYHTANNYSINTMDAMSFRAFLAKHSDVVASVAMMAGKDNHPSRRMR